MPITTTIGTITLDNSVTRDKDPMSLEELAIELQGKYPTMIIKRQKCCLEVEFSSSQEQEVERSIVSHNYSLRIIGQHAVGARTIGSREEYRRLPVMDRVGLYGD